MNNVRLFEMNYEKDASTIYEMITEGDIYLFSDPVPDQDYEAFVLWLVQKCKTIFHDFYMIDINGQPAGFIHCFDLQKNEGHCKLTIYVKRAMRFLGVGPVATLLYLDILFKKYALKKVYSTVFSYNSESIKGNLQFGFTREEILYKHHCYEGHYCDLHVFSISKEQFYQLYSDILTEWS